MNEAAKPKLEDYLAQHEPAEVKEDLGAPSGGLPFHRNGSTYISIQHLGKWMQTEDRQEVTDTLERAGYKLSRFKIRAMWAGGGKATEYRYFAKPDEANTDAG